MNEFRNSVVEAVNDVNKMWVKYIFKKVECKRK